MPLPAACSLGSNNLTDYGEDMSGLLKLVEILPLTKIENLGCATASKCSLLCQRPLTRTCSLIALAQPPGSISRNGIGPEGASALAAVLKETQITTLKCAAAP